jgi:hypothetical protein
MKKFRSLQCDISWLKNVLVMDAVVVREFGTFLCHHLVKLHPTSLWTTHVTNPLRVDAWNELIGEMSSSACPDHARTRIGNDWDEMIAPNVAKPGRILAMPESRNSPASDCYKTISHSLGYTRLLLWLLVVTWPCWLCRAIIRRIHSGSWAPPFEESLVVDLIANTSLIMLVHPIILPCGKRAFSFELPDDLPVFSEANGVSPAGLHLCFGENRLLIAAALKGEDILDESAMIAGLLNLALAYFVHPKLHFCAELLVAEIGRKEIIALEPSSRYTFSLHERLLTGSLSPIMENWYNPLWIGTTFASATAGMAYKLPSHKPQQCMRKFPYYDFMYQAHSIVDRLTKKYKLEISSINLINGSILHSIDHYSLVQVFSKNCRHDMMSMDGRGTLKGHLHFSMFSNVWNPAPAGKDEYIKNMDPDVHPFYHELFHMLYELDPQLAENILTSTSH